jgi:hypothetical protein
VHRIYPEKIELHDVRDVEAFCSTVARERLRRWRAVLEPCDQEDLVVFLVTVAWEESKKYDPTFGRSFSTHATQVCRNRAVDWYRQRFVDTRYHERPQLSSIDAFDLTLRDYEVGVRHTLGLAATTYEEAELSTFLADLHPGELLDDPDDPALEEILALAS